MTYSISIALHVRYVVYPPTLDPRLYIVKECGKIVAKSFFPVDSTAGDGKQSPLCERDYFRRLDLLCGKCDNALRGSYIEALGRKYHLEHFQCDQCDFVFGAQDSYYEHDDKVYCYYHYSSVGERCYGCDRTIHQQFVEILRNDQNQRWHPDCYMIYKYWNVKLASEPTSGTSSSERPHNSNTPTIDERHSIEEEDEKVRSKVYRIWSVLSTFEEQVAKTVSDCESNLRHCHWPGMVLSLKAFIIFTSRLFRALDVADSLVRGYDTKGTFYISLLSTKLK